MRTILIVLGAVVALAAIAVGILLWVGQPAEPGAFYDPPDEIPVEPGTLIRQEPYAKGVTEGAEGWLILYSSTARSGSPAWSPAAAWSGPRAS